MASTGINWNNFVLNNDGIKDFQELIPLATLEGGDISQFITDVPNTYNGDKLDGIGQFAEVGLAGGTTCAPTFNSSQARSVEKTWVLGEWEIPEKICYKDVDGTAARYGLNAGTEIADISGTVIERIITPLMLKSLKRMYWRLAWFGDLAAANIADGGKITDGLNIELFKTNDGFFKKFNALAAATPARLTNIAANEQVTYALQMSTLTNAVEILDAMIYNAPLELRTVEGVELADGSVAPTAYIMATQSLCDAYEKQLKGTTAYTELQWQTGIEGLKFFRRGGVDIYAIPIWDKYIQTYEDNGTYWNNPHRALYTTKSNLFSGHPGTNPVSVFDAWFSKDDQDFKMLARDKFGVLILDDTLFQLAI